jgi:AcrR family transcriptional regulator
MERRRLQTRDKLKQAGLEVLIEAGYADLTIKAVTDRADLGYGTFYLHFSDKDDLVWAIVYDIAETQRQMIDERLVGVPFPRREYLSWVYLFEYLTTVREGFVATMGSQGSAKLLQRYMDYLAALHESNLRSGHFSANLNLPPDFLAQYMTGALMRLLLWWAENPNPYTPEDMAKMVYQAAYRQPPPES